MANVDYKLNYTQPKHNLCEILNYQWMVISISFVKTNISILMPKQIVCVNIAMSHVINII
jgi:hypothetical protein